MHNVGYVVLIRCLFGLATSVSLQQGPSDGLADNVVTASGECVWFTVSLPESLAKMTLDSRVLSCDNGWCRGRGDDDTKVEYQQEKEENGYLTKANICTHDNPFSIGWQLNDFHVDNRITRITQFFAPNGDWSTSKFSCIRPQYSLPLIRNATEGSGMQVKCAISRKICGSSENVVIFDLNKVFCQYDHTVKTCERREVDNDTIIFATTVSNTEGNKYHPDQYVFCNAMGSGMSIKLTWSRDASSSTTEETAPERTTDLDDGQSNGLEDNVVSVTGECIWVESNLPETLTKIFLDRRSLSCEEGRCSARGDDDMQVEYQQERVENGYLTKANICTHDNPFSIGWQLNDFHVDNRITRITQFFAPNGDWSTSKFSCIRPQYSLPLIRNATEGSGMQVQCAISRKICGSSENVVIFDLNKVFCQYDHTVKTCERREVDNDTIIFATTVSNTEGNKYHPDQYVFCNAMGSGMSIKLTWSRDASSSTTEETAPERTTDLERREVDNDTIIFATTVSNTEGNKYHPDQYVFCNAMGSGMSIKLTWSRDASSSTTEETAPERTTDLDVSPLITKDALTDRITDFANTSSTTVESAAESTLFLEYPLDSCICED
ncbi:hypothetical protein SprV_0802516500 [Sparganum proliferum]